MGPAAHATTPERSVAALMASRDLRLEKCGEKTRSKQPSLDIHYPYDPSHPEGAAAKFIFKRNKTSL